MKSVLDYSYGALLTIKEYKDNVKSGMFIDYDGSGYAVYDGLVDDSVEIYPSDIKKLPPTASHIIWFNR